MFRSTRGTRRLRPLALAALAVLAPAAGRAAPLLSSAAEACSLALGGGRECDLEVGSDSAQAAWTFGTPGETPWLHSTAQATAAFGSLAVTAGYDAGQVSESDFGGSLEHPTARFEDELTVSGGTGAGQAVLTFHVRFSAHTGCGTVQPCLSELPFFDASGHVAAGGGALPEGPAVSEVLNTGPPADPWDADLESDLTTDPIPFEFGQPRRIYASLEASTNPYYEFGQVTPPPGANSQGIASGSIVLARIDLFDAQGEPLPAAALSAGSGHEYPVPEPGPQPEGEAAAFGLALSASACAAARGRRRA